MRRPTILLIEDEPLLVSLYEKLLKQGPYRILTATEEVEAIRLLEAERPHLVLLDLVIPTSRRRGETPNFHEPVGYDVLRQIGRLRKQGERLKVVIITNVDSDEHRNRCFALGAEEFWVKAAFDPHELPKRVDAVMAKP